MDTVHWSQEIAMKPMEDIVVTQNSSKSSFTSKTSSTSSSSSLERRSARPQKESAVNCPRCNSTNTKFCYYNNYSLSQPRYFCKTCRRYWTDGGSLRNVPVGGGSRKNRRSSSSSSSSSSISSHGSFLIPKKLPDLVVPPPAPTSVLSQNPRIHHEHGQDLNLGFPSSDDFKTSSCSSNLSALELLTGITTRGIVNNSFMPIPIPDTNSVYSSSGELMLPMPDFKIPSLNFSLDGIGGNGDGGSYGGNIHESSNGRLLFPFEDLKTASTISTTTTTAATATTDQDGHQNVEENRDENGDSNGFWTGMLGGGSW